MITGLSHFSFTVSDVGRAAAWYVSQLDFELLRRQRQDNAYTREFVGVPGAVLEVAILAQPGQTGPHGVLLELIEYVQPISSGVQPEPGGIGFCHLSLTVDEIHDEYRRLSANGASFRSEPVAITAGANAGGFVCYFTDPDGNGLELFQPPAKPPLS